VSSSIIAYRSIPSLARFRSSELPITDNELAVIAITPKVGRGTAHRDQHIHVRGACSIISTMISVVGIAANHSRCHASAR
jgi:hypothetical protein